jgi:hypothetical protein
MRYWEVTAANLGKPVSVGAVLQLWIAKGGQFGLPAQIAVTPDASLCTLMKS